jgi:hypothetical protein
LAALSRQPVGIERHQFAAADDGDDGAGDASGLDIGLQRGADPREPLAGMPTSSGFARGKGSSANAAVEASRQSVVATILDAAIGRLPFGLCGPYACEQDYGNAAAVGPAARPLIIVAQ